MKDGCLRSHPMCFHCFIYTCGIFNADSSIFSDTELVHSLWELSPISIELVRSHALLFLLHPPIAVDVFSFFL